MGVIKKNLPRHLAPAAPPAPPASPASVYLPDVESSKKMPSELTIG